MSDHELEHAHRCPFCATQYDCVIMFCRGLAFKTCWPCRQRGFSDEAPTVSALRPRGGGGDPR